MKSKKILIALVILVAVATIVSIYILDQPRYAFSRVGQAIKDHDIDLFEKYADIDAIVDTWVQWSSEEARRDLEKRSKTKNNPISESFVELLMPTMRLKLKEEFKQKIVNSIENTGKDNELSGLPLINLALLPIHKLTIEKNIATIEVLHPTSEEKIIFTLKHMPERYWRLIGIQIPALMNRGHTIPLEKMDSQPIIPEDNAPIPTPPSPALTKRDTQNNVKLNLQTIPESSPAREEAINKTIIYTEYYQQIKNKITQNIIRDNKKLGRAKFTLKVIILANGQLKDLSIISGPTKLNQNILELTANSVKSSSPFPPFPPELNASEFEFTIPVSSEKN